MSAGPRNEPALAIDPVTVPSVNGTAVSIAGMPFGLNLQNNRDLQCGDDLIEHSIHISLDRGGEDSSRTVDVALIGIEEIK